MVDYIHPANPNASDDAKRLLNWLAGLPGRENTRVVSGQFVDHGQHAEYGYNERIVKLQQATGKWAAMAGFDYCDVWSQQSGPWSDPEYTNTVATAYWNSGGLVLMHHHFLNPWTGESPWKFETVGDIADLVDEQTEVHDAWIANVDKLAAGLANLRDAGVVVLFSPFNEMNGGWFWWGHGDYNYESWVSQEDFINLWQYLFDYLTDTKNLNNLLWLYCPTAQWSTAWKAVDYYYPGDAYVDIAAITYYADSLDDININDSYDKSIALGKPFGIGGMGPDSEDGTYGYDAFINKIKADYPETSFFLAWHQQWAIVENQGATALMNDPWVIIREEVDWRSGPIPDEIIIDDTDAGFSTSFSQDAWQKYTQDGGKHYGNSHYYNEEIGSGQDTATWSFTVPEPGNYDVYAWWWEKHWRPSDVPYTVNHFDGSTTVRMDQRANGGQWNLLGTFYWHDEGSVVVSDDVSSGRGIVADAIRLVYRSEGEKKTLLEELEILRAKLEALNVVDGTAMLVHVDNALARLEELEVAKEETLGIE